MNMRITLTKALIFALSSFITFQIIFILWRIYFKGFEVTVVSDRPFTRTGKSFIGITLDTTVLFQRWEKFNPDDPVAIKLAQALSPGYLRVGGAAADALSFTEHTLESIPKHVFTATDWDRLNTFCRRTNLSLVFTLNSLHRKDGVWDHTNAISLIRYSAYKGYMLDWQLGNEPDVYPRQFKTQLDAKKLGQDYSKLRSILDSTPPYHNSKLYGPDVTQVQSKYARWYTTEFMKTGSKFIDAMTFHHYNMNGSSARAEDFISVKKLDTVKYSMKMAKQVVRDLGATSTKFFWLSETSSGYASGTPGLSDTFLAGFMWLDKLGLCAAAGAEVVVRQDFVGGHYGLVDNSNGTYSPNPDYWLTIIYKRLVGETVLKTRSGDKKMRIYSHCTNSRAGYGPGAVTFYMMSLYNTTQYVSFSQFEGRELHLYALTSGNPDSLVSRKVRLNGNVLELNHLELPRILPIIHRSTQVQIMPFTMLFVVIPDAGAVACTHTT